MQNFLAIAFSLFLVVYTVVYVWIIISVFLNGKEEPLFSEELDELAQDL